MVFSELALTCLQSLMQKHFSLPALLDLQDLGTKTFKQHFTDPPSAVSEKGNRQQQF